MAVYTANQTDEGIPQVAGKYLTFMLDKETYGLEILRVQEIIGLQPITRVPKVAESIRGVINLRGKVIPVLDLSKRFGLEAIEDTPRTCIIVTELLLEDEIFTMGLLVDDVSEVVDIGADAIEPPPNLGAGVETNLLRGMGKIGERVVMLLDVSRILCIGTVSGLLEKVEAA
ncbi:MAG: hypothetical protein AMXMBFR84_29070 [Candidatus Hydrogenedentota bacterium]